MKILYITSVDLGVESGVRKKIYGQIKAMRNADLKVSLIAPIGNEIFLIEQDRKLLVGKFRKGFLTDFFNRVSELYRCSYRFVIEKKYDAVFIRYSFSENSFLRLLKKLKKKQVKVFIEIPTYPYDFEFDYKQWYKKYMLYIDVFYRNKLKKHVDLIFTPSSIASEYVYGIKAYTFDNGIDLEIISRRNYVGAESDTLRFIGVANLTPSQGYDRIIRGISEYYKRKEKIKFIFNIVGDGIEFANLKKLTKQLSLEDKIIFYGRKFGRDLDKLYDSSDVAVSTIGFKTLAQSLKTREACIKGIPFILAKGDPVFDSNFKYAYFIKTNDEIIDVEDIYRWFVELNPKIYTKEMYNFGMTNLGWDETFKDVIRKMQDIR